MKKLVIVGLSIFMASVANAGGSITREEVMKEVCAKSAAICSAMPSLAKVGTAVRAQDGSRLMPYEFGATTSSGAAVRVEISVDEDGKLVLTIKE